MATVSPMIYSFAAYTQYPKIVGHIAENCSSEQRLCYNCRQAGHESSACPSPRTVSAKQCYTCGGVGHIQGIHYSLMLRCRQLTHVTQRNVLL